MSPVLFIGIGMMGEPMVTRLVRGGYDVYLYDVDEAKATALADKIDAKVVHIAEYLSMLPTFQTVILMLPSSAIVEQVLEGENGILEFLKEETVLIDMSSSVPSSTKRLAEKAAELNIGFLDAPVSGGVPKAITGELSIMCGGQSEIFEARKALLQHMGTSVALVGEHGAGHALKALNNLLSAIGMVGASEVLSIATKFGIDPSTALDVINNSTGRMQSTEVKFGRYILSRAFDSGFALSLMVKDLKIALDLAHENGISAPISAGALESWIAASTELGIHADHTEIAAYVEKRAAVQLISNDV